ncbi:MAG: dihydroorotase [Lentisphaeria bacterium]|nr:dihydroorotase [Lentisphaeria bacterium]
MKEILFKNARVIDPARGLDAVGDVGVSEGKFAAPEALKSPEVVDLTGKVLSPGFIDIHVHLRQPGNTTAETVASGSRAAAAGGFTSIVAMPNTNPPADTAGAIEYLRRVAEEQAVVRVLPCGNMSKGGKGEEMAGIGSLKAAGVVALSDDGRCIQDHSLMRHVVEYAKSFGLPILDHCEEVTLAAGGVMNEGKWSVLLGMNGIAGASEELIIARNILFAKQIGWRIHMQHVSTAGSAEMLRRARAEGIPVSGEATPHHLTLTDECIKYFDTNYKMNPPLRSESDRQALIAAVADGTITVIATDHAPHTATAKLVEFDNAPFGIIGLETAFPLCFTELVASGVIPVEKLIEKFTVGPAEVLGLRDYSLSEGNPADVTVIDPKAEYVIDKAKFFSKSRNTPFDGRVVRGRVEMTMVGGRIVYRDGRIV